MATVISTESFPEPPVKPPVDIGPVVSAIDALILVACESAMSANDPKMESAARKSLGEKATAAHTRLSQEVKNFNDALNKRFS